MNHDQMKDCAPALHKARIKRRVVRASELSASIGLARQQLWDWRQFFHPGS